MAIQVVGLLFAAFILSYFVAPFYIRWLKRKQFGQFVREDGPEAHLKKTGTPTMGGVIFLAPIVLLYIFVVDITKFDNLLLLFTILFIAFIGGIDDISKVLKRQNEGLTSRQKFGLQVGFAVLAYILFIHGKVSTDIAIPFFEEPIKLGWLYAIFCVFLIVGASNATNLTDGLDGLLTGNAIISFATFAVIAFVKGNETVFFVALLFVGALIGFLIYNFNPAKVFMGDMGSLVLGAVMATMAIVLKVEILLVLIGLVYVVETLSVIMQVTSFKLTGRRIFKMSPIHHHFEMVGFDEKGIFILFVSVQTIFALLAICFMN